MIGFVGSDDKAKWLIEELGFDRVYNYKTTNWDQCLQDAASNGVDCYFDTVQYIQHDFFCLNKVSYL